MIYILYAITLLSFFYAELLIGQTEPVSDSSSSQIIPVQDAVYSRPFITDEKIFSASIGGYCEANTNYFSTDGISEGLSLELRRFNIFLFSSLSPGIKFISELEFEHGTEEIRIETAQLDLEIMSELVLRGGIILVPIGSFNLNHDSPKWDIIDRPLVSTLIIPSTFSEIGFGIHGRALITKGLSLTYSGYITNGLAADVILNSEGRTFLQAGKSAEIFAEDNNGSPAISARAAAIFDFGEIGLSQYNCIYNNYKADGFEITPKRFLTITAADISIKLKKLRIDGEAAYNTIDVPDNISEMFGNRQWGAYLDISYPIFNFSFMRFQNVVINGIIRLETVDFNIGKFETTGLNIYDEINSITGGISIRFSTKSLIKLNYKYQWSKDAIGNPVSRTAGIQFGFATYF